MPSWSNKIQGQTVEKALKSMQKGFETDFAPNARIQFNGKSYTRSDLVALIEAAIAPYEQARQLQIQLRIVVAKRNAADPENRALIEHLRDVVKAHVGRDRAKTWKYGMRPRKKRRKLSAQQKLVAVAKARATRKLRGTMGKRQKLKIKAQGQPTVTVRLVPKEQEG